MISKAEVGHSTFNGENLPRLSVVRPYVLHPPPPPPPPFLVVVLEGTGIGCIGCIMSIGWMVLLVDICM